VVSRLPPSRAKEDATGTFKMLVPLLKEVSGEDQLEFPPCPQASRRLPRMAFPPA
jgi:hypothetical protein